LRRLEDFAVADDPLLNMRLGLPLTPTARVIARTRRSAKAIGRWTTEHAGWPLLVCIAAILLMVTAVAHSVALASLLASPWAFAMGIVVARRRQPRPPHATAVERRRPLDQST
jgi:hypothetical protein